jgi:hypothetical protein
MERWFTIKVLNSNIHHKLPVAFQIAETGFFFGGIAIATV